MVVNIRGNQIFMDFVRFLIHKVSYAWCLRHICSAWFLDIRILTCCQVIIHRQMDTQEDTGTDMSMNTANLFL